MEIMGTNFSITIGSWRLRLCVAIEDVEALVPEKEAPHHVRLVRDDEYLRREA